MRPVQGVVVGALLVITAAAAGCTGGDDDVQGVTEETPKTVQVSSPFIQEGGPFPRKYTCQGEDTSPPLDIGNLPEDAKTIALVLDDPDAPNGTWLHWTFWDVPAETTTIPEGADITTLGGTEGTTDFGDVGYGGPCPPGGTHEYRIKAYALDTELGLDGGASLDELTEAMDGHVLAWGQLKAVYTKN